MKVDSPLYIGKRHYDENGNHLGGIKVVVDDSKVVEVEGLEMKICREAYNSKDVLKFKNKTNKEVLDFIHGEFSCKFEQGKANSGDWILCRLVVLDNNKKDFSGTVKQILDKMQKEHSCRVSYGGNSMKQGGQIKDGKIISANAKKFQKVEISEEELADRWHKKKEHITQMAENVQSLRYNVTKDIKSQDEKVKLTALAISVILNTAERVGNSDSEENGNLGVTGFQKKNIKIEGNTVYLEYVGKSSVEHEKQFSDELISLELRRAMKKSPCQFVFCTSDGFRIKADKINRYLQEFGVTAKDLRGFLANRYILDKLNKIDDAEILADESKRKKEFNKIIKSVALKVGHGAPTLKKHYMTPELESEFIENGVIISLKDFYKSGGEIKQAEVKKLKEGGGGEGVKIKYGGTDKDFKGNPQKQWMKPTETSEQATNRLAEFVEASDYKGREQSTFIDKKGESVEVKLRNDDGKWNWYEPKSKKPFASFDNAKDAIKFIQEQPFWDNGELNKNGRNNAYFAKVKADYIKRELENGNILEDINDGKISAKDAKKIIESASLEVPKDIVEPSLKETPKASSGGVGADNLALKEIGVEIKKDNTSEGFYQVYKDGKFVGLLGSTSFVQARNKGQHFDEGLMSDILTRMGIEHSKAERNIQGENEFLTIRIKNSKAVEQSLIGQPTEVSVIEDKSVSDKIKIAENIIKGYRIKSKYVKGNEVDRVNGIIKAYEVRLKMLSKNKNNETTAVTPTDIKTVRDLANLDAESQNGLLSGAFFSSLKIGDEFTVANKKYSVANISKPTEKSYISKDQKQINYKESKLRIKDANGETINGVLWEFEKGSSRWWSNSSKRIDKWGHLSRNIEGDISVDLINEYNKLHTFSDSYKKVQDAINSSIKDSSGSDVYADGGEIKDKIVCSNCGWSWNLKDTEPKDAYVCHKCGHDMSSQYCIAPNGKPSNLTPQQYALVRTPQFKAWFGDWQNDKENSSKIIDENGEPLVVYHGTFKKFNVFEISTEGGYFFTEFKRIANIYAETVQHGIANKKNESPIVIEGFINIKNPRYIDFYGAVVKRVSPRINSAKKNGFDGLIIKNGIDIGGGNYEQYVCFKSNQIKLADGSNTTFDSDNTDIRYNNGGAINDEAQQYIDIISMNPNLEKYQKYKLVLKDKFGIDFDIIYKDQEYIDNANLNDIKTQQDFFDFSNWIKYSKKVSRIRGFIPMDLYDTPNYIMTDDIWNKTAKELNFTVEKVPYKESGRNSGDIARTFADKIMYTEYADLYYFLHELGHIYDFQNKLSDIVKNPAYSPTNYGTTNGGETFAENFAIYFINPNALKDWNREIYDAVDLAINDKYKIELKKIIDESKVDKIFENGGLIKINDFNKNAKLELKKWDYEHCETIEEKIKAVQGLYANEYYKLKNIIPTAEPDNERKEIYWQRVSFKNNDYIIGFHFWFDIFSKDKLKLSKVDIQLYDEDYNELDIIFEEGGVIDDHKETYEKWKTLVNMSKSELEKFYHSKEGEEAGLSAAEANKLGIHSGRESAKWIMKMKDTPHGEWTPTMWEWAKRQIRFISRMSGNRGELYDSKGNKTRKHTSLLIWGHNPTKNMETYKSGGAIASNQVVGGIIKAEDTNRYLILQRGLVSGDYAKWHFVCGGVDGGESKEDAIKREVFEEIGYVINSGIKLKETKHFHNYDFTYFDIIVPKQFTPKINYENMNYAWVDSLEDALNYDLLSVVREYIEGELKMKEGGVVPQEKELQDEKENILQAKDDDFVFVYHATSHLVDFIKPSDSSNFKYSQKGYVYVATNPNNAKGYALFSSGNYCLYKIKIKKQELLPDLGMISAFGGEKTLKSSVLLYGLARIKRQIYGSEMELVSQGQILADGGIVANATTEKISKLSEKYDLGGLIQSSVINKILKEVKPYQEEITQKWIESVKKEGDNVLREHDIEDFRFVLIMDLVKAIGNYIEPTDSVSDIKFTRSQGSILLNCTILRDGNEFPFSTDVIFAGGYNIQKLHLRYIVNTKLPHKKTNTYFDKLNSEYKKFTKIEKIKEQITYCEDHLERYKEKVEEARLNSLLSDEEIEKISREKDSDKNWRLVDTSWDEIVKRGADKNFNYDKNEYLKKLKSIKEDYIYHWKLIFANPKQYENSVKREQKELDKLQKKLEELQADNIEDKLANNSAIKLKLKSLLSILDSEKKYGKVENYKGIFNTKTTGISGLDELLKDDGYNYFYKGISGEVVMMSPSDYLEKVRTDITRTDTDLGIYAEKKERINEAIEKGNKINMPFLSIKENGKAHQQEGRNRATIAKERGEKLIPVFIEKYLTFNDKIAKGNEYTMSAISNGATTKEEVLSKLKEQGLHRDAIRFIDENFNAQLLEPSYKEKAEEGGDSSLQDFYIEENYDCENYQKAIKFAKENGYYLKNDISYNGFIFIEKLLEGGEEKIEIQVYDGITKDDVPNVEVLTKEAEFGSIMSETKYRFLPTQYHKKWDRDWYDLMDLDTALAYAKNLEKNILEHNKNITTKESEQSIGEQPKASSDSVLADVKPMSDNELQQIVGYEVYKRIIKAEEQLGEGVVDRNRMIETARRIQKADKSDKLLTQHIFEALHYEIGYPDNWQDLRNAINKGGIDTNSEAIQRKIEVGVDLPKDIVEEFKKSNRYKTANPELVKAVEKSLKETAQASSVVGGDVEKVKVFRGEGNRMGNGVNEGFNWVSSSKEHASEFSDNVIESEIPKPKKTYKFPYARISQPITGEQLVGAIDKAITKAVKEKTITETKWKEINEKKKELSNIVSSKTESFQTKVNDPKSSKLISEILSDLGYDAIEVNDGGITNYGLIKPKAVEKSFKAKPQSETESTLITLANTDTFPESHKRFVENLIKNTLQGINESKQGLEKLARSYGINEQNTAKELAELSIVMIARVIAHKKNLSNKERYDELVNLYKNQVNLTHRTSNSIGLQQYSTPCYIGYIMGLYCGVNADGGSYFEPTAGNGQLTVASRAQDFIVNEIDDIRFQNLEVQGFKEVLKIDASVPFAKFSKKFDAVITNPPFGTIEPVMYDKIEIKSLEQQMALIALETMKDDGKAAIIIGGHTEWDSEGRIQAGKNRTFFVLLNRMYHVEDVINISGRDLYSRQGTAFNTRIILINGRKKEKGGFPLLLNKNLSVTENNSSKIVSLFEDLYTRVTNLL